MQDNGIEANCYLAVAKVVVMVKHYRIGGCTLE
jgi:hypothetical protein